MVLNFILYRISRSASHWLGTRSLSAEIRKISKAWIVCLPPGTIRGDWLGRLVVCSVSNLT